MNIIQVTAIYMINQEKIMAGVIDDIESYFLGEKEDMKKRAIEAEDKKKKKIVHHKKRREEKDRSEGLKTCEVCFFYFIILHVSHQ